MATDAGIFVVNAEIVGLLWELERDDLENIENRTALLALVQRLTGEL